MFLLGERFFVLAVIETPSGRRLLYWFVRTNTEEDAQSICIEGVDFGAKTSDEYIPARVPYRYIHDLNR